MQSKNIITIIFLISTVFFTSCKKFLEIDPPKGKLSGETLFTSDQTAVAAMFNNYSRMAAATDQISLITGLSSDELKSFSTDVNQLEVFKNSISPSNSLISNLWSLCYERIYNCNVIIEELDKSNAITPSVKSQLYGEAKFVRALNFFYLINLWGDVPLVTSTDYRINSILPRSSKASVEQLIIEDLKSAKLLLNDNYLNAQNSVTTERVRPNKYAASALLAKVYLYKGDWVNAETEASFVIANSSKYSLVSLDNVFLKNNNEAIWQLQPVGSNKATKEGTLYVLTAAPTNVSLTDTLYKSFESGDGRKTKWTHDTIILGNTYHYSFKYKVKTNTTTPTEYSTVLRLAEQYLIRAEARANQNNLLGAITDLNSIRSRAGLSSLSTSLTLAQINAGIEQERKSELFCEWGNRWLDLKRFGKADAELSQIKVTGWQPTDVLYPIPQSEINKDVHLIQNPGY